MSDAQTEAAARAAMGVTGPQHASIARFAGTWRAEVKIWMQPGQPPMTSSGTMVNAMAVGGLFLQQEYQRDGGDFEGKGFWGYNTVDELYEGFWIDSMATFFQLERGRHDPQSDTYTMDGSMTDPASRKTITKKSLIRWLGPDAHSMEMFFRTPDGREFRALEIQYRRA